MRMELVTSLKRRATKIIKKLEDEPGPVVITQHGRPAAYLMGIQAYDTLQQRVSILEGIARGERAIEEGRIVPHGRARKRMARWLK
jgi:prevent-host-death family protein